MTSNAHRSRARAAQKESGESYMRARRRVDRNTAADTGAADDAGAILTGLGLDASGASTQSVSRLWGGWGGPGGVGPLIRVPIGVNPEGEPVWLDVNEAAAGGQGPHIVVGGIAGSGKTTLLRVISYALCLSHAPDKLDVAFVDVDDLGSFADFADYPHASFMANDLAEIDEDLDFRMRAQKSAAVHTLADYHAVRAAGPRADLPPILPYRLVVIDGTDRLSPQNRDRLHRLLRLGRSVGICTLVGLEYPDRLGARVCDYANGRIALKADSAAMSRAIIDTDQAVGLETPGGGILARMVSPRQFSEFQGYRLGGNSIRGTGRILAEAASVRASGSQ